VFVCAGGISFNESLTHFHAWCIVSSPLVLSHDLASDTEYDKAWPIISNKAAIEVDQTYAGDAGRLVKMSTSMMTNLSLFNGFSCQCFNPNTELPEWMVLAKRLNRQGTKAAVLAINLIDVAGGDLPAGHIRVPFADIFADDDDDDDDDDDFDLSDAVMNNKNGHLSESPPPRPSSWVYDSVEFDIAMRQQRATTTAPATTATATATTPTPTVPAEEAEGERQRRHYWFAPKLSPRSSYFAIVKRHRRQ